MQPDRAAELNQTAFPHALTIFPSPPFIFDDRLPFGASSLRYSADGTILVFERYAFLYMASTNGDGRTARHWYVGAYILAVLRHH